MPIEKYGGADRDRTDDILLAKQALSQLSYSPIWFTGFRGRPLHPLALLALISALAPQFTQWLILHEPEKSGGPG